MIAYNSDTMTQPTPREPFVFTFPRDDKGEEMPYRFMLTLSKNFGTKIGTEDIGTRLTRALLTLDGIDAFSQGVGRYTVEVTIARTFDPAEVLEELKRRLKNDVLSEIIRPPLVTP